MRDTFNTLWCLNGPKMVAPPHGLLGETRAKIIEILRTHDSSAREVAEALGIQVSAARKHLERLRNAGIVAVTLRRQPRGRPSKRYALTEDGRELFPRRYDVVLNALISALEADRGGGYVESVLGRTARNSLPRSLGDVSPRRRLRPLLGTLNELGFEASLRREGDEVVVTSRNCPLLRTATEHRELVCHGLHAALIGQAIDADVQREKWILSGDGVCTHRFRLRRDARPARDVP